MSTPRTETTGEPDDKQRARFDAADETLTKSLLRRVRDGSVPLLAGAALLAEAARTRGRGGSARGWALAAAALVALGLRQRWSTIGLPDATDVGLRDDSTGKDVSDEAHAATVRNDTGRQPEEEPEGEVHPSPAADADEPGEASGPDPAQSQPAQTEDTDPEASPEADVSHTRADVPDGDAAVDRGDDETGATGKEETADAAEADDGSETNREW